MSDEYVDDKHAKKVCLIGRSEKTCRYLTLGTTGWSCEKLTNIGKFLNMRAEKMQQISRGDNCEGRKSRSVGTRQ